MISILSCLLLVPVLTLPGVRVEYAERDAAAARRTGETIRGIEGDVGARLGVAVPEPVDVVLAESDPAFDREFAARGGRGAAPAWALAVAIPDAASIVVRTTRLEAFTDNDLRLTLAHELAHLALGTISPSLPRWLDEGLAEWASGRRLASAERTTLERLARSGTLATLEELEAGFPLHADEAHVAYVESLAFVEALAAGAGPDSIPRFLRALAGGTPFARAFERAFDAPLRGVEIAWRADLASRYSIARDLYERGSLYTLLALLLVVAFARYRRKRAALLSAMGEPPPPREYPEGERDNET
ncbi:MAG TPA: hypothetical protein VHF22_03725 [Planctomycetota bacterium]|nr:hypothetical protein [Planctomycetota bacterium]